MEAILGNDWKILCNLSFYNFVLFCTLKKPLVSFSGLFCRTEVIECYWLILWIPSYNHMHVLAFSRPQYLYDPNLPYILFWLFFSALYVQRCPLVYYLTGSVWLPSTSDWRTWPWLNLSFISNGFLFWNKYLQVQWLLLCAMRIHQTFCKMTFLLKLNLCFIIQF